MSIEIRVICDDGVIGPWRVVDDAVEAMVPRPEGLRDLHDALLRYFQGVYDEIRQTSRYFVPTFSRLEIRGTTPPAPRPPLQGHAYPAIVSEREDCGDD